MQNIICKLLRIECKFDFQMLCKFIRIYDEGQLYYVLCNIFFQLMLLIGISVVITCIHSFFLAVFQLDKKWFF